MIDITGVTDTGTMVLTYNTVSIPDRFTVYWDGQEVINTGFRGNAAYNNDLAALGYPPVSGGATGSASFVKSASTPSSMTIYVEAPLEGTVWSATLACPPI